MKGNDVSTQCLRIGSCLAYVYRVMDARGKFGEHESVRVYVFTLSHFASRRNCNS